MSAEKGLDTYAHFSPNWVFAIGQVALFDVAAGGTLWLTIRAIVYGGLHG